MFRPFWLVYTESRKYWIKKSCLLLLNSAKQLSESSIHCCFCSILSKRGTHLENISLIFFRLNHKRTSSWSVYHLSNLKNFHFAVIRHHYQNMLNIFPHYLYQSDRVSISIPLSNRWFRWRWVRITLFKPLLSLHCIFSHKIAIVSSSNKSSNSNIRNSFCCIFAPMQNYRYVHHKTFVVYSPIDVKILHMSFEGWYLTNDISRLAP